MQARADRTRRIILLAAAERFEASGYTDTRLQDVVAGRAVSKGALYFHFPSKADLAAAIIDEQRAQWSAMAAELSAEHPRAIRRLLALLHRAADLFTGNVMTRAGTRLTCERGGRIGGVPLFDEWTDLVEGLLHEAGAQGDLAPGVQPRLVAELIVATFTGLHRAGLAEPPGDGLHRRLAEMWQLLLPGLVAPHRAAELVDDFRRGDAPPSP